MAPRFLAPLLAFATSLAAGSAVAEPAVAEPERAADKAQRADDKSSALDDCDQYQPSDMSVPAEAVDVVDVVDVVVEAPQVAEVVVPCAMVESGVLGPACQDAAFYVVNQHGTLLCRVDLAVFTQGGALPIVEQAPAIPGGPQGGGVVFAVVPVLPPSLPAGTVRELSRGFTIPSLDAADAHLWDRPRPS